MDSPLLLTSGSCKQKKKVGKKKSEKGEFIEVKLKILRLEKYGAP